MHKASNQAIVLIALPVYILNGNVGRPLLQLLANDNDNEQ